jgi:RimJ/RimL family protein N-acetyltransferase
MTTALLRTARFDLEPLSPTHAEEMVVVLADRALYAFYDDEPSPSLDELRERYRRQAAGVSSDGLQVWHNWIVRDRATGACIGFVQATVTDRDAEGSRRDRVAELAWVVATAHQRRGVAVEAAQAVRDHERNGPDAVRTIAAHIAPGHVASEAVARALGLRPTDRTVDGETVWEGS